MSVSFPNVDNKILTDWKGYEIWRREAYGWKKKGISKELGK